MDNSLTIVEDTLIPHTAFVAASKRVKQCVEHSGASPEPICIALVGESGTGKSRLLEDVASMYPSTRTAEGLTVPIARIRTPTRPTVKGLAGLLLKVLGDPRWESGTEIARTSRAKDLARECGLRALFLDEFHHFFDKGTDKVFHDAADWLKTFADETCVTVVVSGLESCLPVLRQNEQLSRRFLAPVFLRRFNWQHETDRASLLGILGAFDTSLAQRFTMPALSSEEMGFRFWCASGGLIGYVAKLLRQAVWDACDARKNRIELGDFAAAFEKAIAAEEQRADIPNPFNPNFSTVPTAESETRALSIGVRELEDQEVSRPRRLSKKSLSQVITARGS